MTDKEIEECYNSCIEYSNKIKNPILRECCQKIYSDYKEKLINKPATQGRHHCFKGGLLHHIYCVTRNAYQIAKVLHMIGGHMKEFMEEGIFVKMKMIEVIIISYADDIDSYLEPVEKAIDKVEKGKKYQISIAETPYCKSLNPYYLEVKNEIY